MAADRIVFGSLVTWGSGAPRGRVVRLDRLDRLRECAEVELLAGVRGSCGKVFTRGSRCEFPLAELRLAPEVVTREAAADWCRALRSLADRHSINGTLSVHEVADRLDQLANLVALNAEIIDDGDETPPSLREVRADLLAVAGELRGMAAAFAGRKEVPGGGR